MPYLPNAQHRTRGKAPALGIYSKEKGTYESARPPVLHQLATISSTSTKRCRSVVTCGPHVN